MSNQTDTVPSQGSTTLPSRGSDLLFLMGNGPSLGKLNDDEKSAIATHDSMAMNLYIKHYRDFGIVPQHFIQLDYDEISAEILKDLPELVSDPAFSMTTFWFTSYWQDQCDAVRDRSRLVRMKWPNLKVPLRPVRRFWKPGAMERNYSYVMDKFKQLLGPNLSYERVSYHWGRLPNSPIFRLNGTLTSALNIAWLLGYKEVQLVGVDLNDGTHFHHTDTRIVARERESHGINSIERHATTVWSTDGTVPPVTHVLRQIEKLYRKTGRRLYVSNPRSVLAIDAIVPHRDVLEAARKWSGSEVRGDRS